MLDEWNDINIDDFQKMKLSIPSFCLTNEYIGKLLSGEISSPFNFLGSERNLSLWLKFIVGKSKQYNALFVEKKYSGSFEEYLKEPKTVTNGLLSGNDKVVTLHDLESYRIAIDSIEKNLIDVINIEKDYVDFSDNDKIISSMRKK